MKYLKIRQFNLDDLKWKDFLHGLVDPEEQKVAKRHDLLTWTPYFEKNRLRAFSAGLLG